MLHLYRTLALPQAVHSHTGCWLSKLIFLSWLKAPNDCPVKAAVGCCGLLLIDQHQAEACMMMLGLCCSHGRQHRWGFKGGCHQQQRCDPQPAHKHLTATATAWLARAPTTERVGAAVVVLLLCLTTHHRKTSQRARQGMQQACAAGIVQSLSSTTASQVCSGADKLFCTVSNPVLQWC